MRDKVNIAEKLDTFSDHWSPRIVARYNDNDIMICFSAAATGPIGSRMPRLQPPMNKLAAPARPTRIIR